MAKRDHWTLLDGLRGLAAICVVLRHWDHFAWAGTLAIPRSAYPLYTVLQPAYNYGWIAVDLFFLLSGFVFFWKYEATIRARTTTLTRFFWLRFARLYPLHIATLLLVLILQAIHTSLDGYPFVFSNNDAYHFGLNLLLISTGDSFNGPVWSISIEVMLYGMFFVAATCGMTRIWYLIGFCCIAAAFCDGFDAFLARGVLGFFMGGIVFRISNYAIVRPGLVFFLSSITFPIGIVLMAIFRTDQRMFIISAATVAFPSLVLALVLLENRVRGNYVGWLGDISYSTYMLHFPLQLAIVLLLPFAKITGIGSSLVALFGFFAVLLPLSFLSNRIIERPAQRLLLRKNIGKARIHPNADFSPLLERD
jgi:peptidoglycan/LPS O-acetylase OafA/YrhL